MNYGFFSNLLSVSQSWVVEMRGVTFMPIDAKSLGSQLLICASMSIHTDEFACV